MKRKVVLTPALPWTNPEDMTLSEMSPHKKTNTTSGRFCEAVKVRDGGVVIARGWGLGTVGS